MSSTTPRSKREQRPPRRKIQDFTAAEQSAIGAAQRWFPGDAAVFGSRARGDWAEDSDLDIGVQGYNYKLHKAVQMYLSGRQHFKVDLFKYETALTHRAVVIV